jgi:hypothetical protein
VYVQEVRAPSRRCAMRDGDTDAATPVEWAGQSRRTANGAMTEQVRG